jgi:hypothetical protein
LFSFSATTATDVVGVETDWFCIGGVKKIV